MTKNEGGLVLTMISSGSPARTLMRGQYPSIQGQRYFARGSTRVLESIQSVVPCFSFSVRIRLRRAGADSASMERASGPTVIPSPAPAARLSKSRRFIRGRFESGGLYIVDLL